MPKWTKEEYACIIVEPKQPNTMRSRSFTITLQPMRVSSFTVRNGKEVPTGVEFDYLAVDVR